MTDSMPSMYAVCSNTYTYPVRRILLTSSVVPRLAAFPLPFSNSPRSFERIAEDDSDSPTPQTLLHLRARNPRGSCEKMGAGLNETVGALLLGVLVTAV